MISRIVRTGASLMMIAALAACGGRAFEYRSANEIPPGPGLLTGEEGAFVVRGPGSRETAAPARSSAPAESVPAGPGFGFVEFEAYREYRRAKAERSAEFREFLEWLEWKQYQAWKRKQDSQKQ